MANEKIDANGNIWETITLPDGRTGYVPHTDPNADIGDVTLLPTEAHLGQVGGHSAVVEKTPVLTVHATYVANDYVGTSGAPMTFANCARINGGTGVISRAMLIDSEAQQVAGELWLFDSTVTPPADSASWSISDADAKKCIGVIPINTFYASALNTVGIGDNFPIVFKCAANSKDLFGCFVTRGAPAYVDGGLTIKLRILQD